MEIKEIKKEFENKFVYEGLTGEFFIWASAKPKDIWSFIECSLLAYREEVIDEIYEKNRRNSR